MKRDEQALQRSIVDWLQLVVRRDVRWFHVPNGGARSKVEGAILKGMGVRAGVPDLVFVWSVPVVADDATRRPRLAFLEIKSDTGSLTLEQRDFRDWAVENGIPFEVARSLDEAMLIVREWDLDKTRRAEP